MPRRDKSSKLTKDNNNNNNKGPPPNHPSENYREHRSFLIRSLGRNDVDLAALLKLNASLYEAKEKILQSCGELVLLDLGCGRLKLINDELHEETNINSDGAITPVESYENGIAKTEFETAQVSTQHHLTPAQKGVCVDFLLRMKLRRKLCNRLVRRLTRIATAMDGKDVSPPPPPRYGDLRLLIDPEEVEARVTEWQQTEAARQRIEASLRGDETVYNPKTVNGTISVSTEKPSMEKGIQVSYDIQDTTVKSRDNSVVKKKTSEGAPVLTEEATSGSQNEPAKFSKGGSMPLKVDPVQEKKATTEQIDSSQQTSNDKKDDPTKNNKSEYMDSPFPTLASDYELLQQFDDAYEKVWDQETKSFRYTLPLDGREPEYLKIRNGAGIGATIRGMTLPDRQAEHKRWQTNMLARIPDQPTFEELGLKNRVFFLAERRKRCVDESADDSDDEEFSGSNEPSRKLAKTDIVDTNNEGVSKKEDMTATGGAVMSQQSDMDKKKAGAVSAELESKKPSILDVAQNMPIRPISFAATPSFHEQDLHRLRVIHHDVVKHAALEQARNQLAAVTNEYNNGMVLYGCGFELQTWLVLLTLISISPLVPLQLSVVPRNASILGIRSNIT
jgi:hypothetical protein